MPLGKIKLFLILVAGTCLLIVASIITTSTYSRYAGTPRFISNASRAIGILMQWPKGQYESNGGLTRNVHTGGLPIVTDTFKITKQTYEPYSNIEMTALILGKERAKDFHTAINSTQQPFTSTKNSTIPDAFMPRIYNYILNNKTVCEKGEIFGYALCIYSSPRHFHERREIRKYWGHPNLFPRFPSVTVFFLGAVNDPALQLDLEQESRKYGDLIQANFTDSYKNLSLKGITMLHWLDKYCSNTKYVIKADDDIYTDMFQAVKALQSLQETSLQKYIVGTVIERDVIVRDLFFEAKHVVEKSLLPGQLTYPAYYHGWAYILSSDIIHGMYQAAMATPVFYINDVYISGLLTSQIPGITYLSFEGKVPFNAYIPTYPAFAREWSPEKIEALWCKHLESLRAEDKLIIGASKAKELYRAQCPPNTLKRLA